MHEALVLCGNLSGIIMEWVTHKYVFSVNFSLASPLRLTWQFFSTSDTESESATLPWMLCWLMLKVLLVLKDNGQSVVQIFSSKSTLEMFSVSTAARMLLTLQGLLGCSDFNSEISESEATLTMSLCHLQVCTSTRSLAAKLTTARVSPPPEKQVSTSKVKMAVSVGLLDIPRGFPAVQADKWPPSWRVNRDFYNVFQCLPALCLMSWWRRGSPISWC